jgi:LPS sulfotransferase NodH
MTADGLPEQEPSGGQHLSKAPSKIVVCATQRSGSTIVCEDLTNSGSLGRPDEWFLSWTAEAAKDWRSELEVVKARGTTPNGIFAVKIMANQLSTVDECLSSFAEPASSAGPYPYLRRFFDDALWVWIRRRDTVDQAISHYLARTSGVYHLVRNMADFVPGGALIYSTYRSEASEGGPYDFRAIMANWYALARDNLIWERYFDQAGIVPLEIWYEDAPANIARYVADHMGIEADVQPKPRNIVKMPGNRKDDIRRRFLADLFERTELLRPAAPGARGIQGALSRLHARHRIRREYQLLKASTLFDAAWYLETYPDVARAGTDSADPLSSQRRQRRS